MYKILLMLFLCLWCNGVVAAGIECKNGKRPANYIPVEQRYTKGLLFKVGRCGKPPSFILGTIHSDHPKIREKVAFAEAIMQQSAAAGFEYIEPEDASQLVQRYLIANPAKREALKDVLEASVLKRTTLLLQRFMGMQPAQTQMFKPWAAAVMLQYPPQVSDGEVLDIHLQHLAKEQHIPLYGLETMESQFRIFDALPIQTQIELLRETVANIDRVDDMNQQLIALYLKEDLKGIGQLSDKETALIKQPELRRLFTEVLLIQRNREMVRKLYPELMRGQRFLAVGALHLLGRGGMLERLEKIGFMVQPLSAKAGTSTDKIENP